MSPPHYRFVFLGLSITSSWGNGHATTYRALLKQLALRGHDVLFLERDLPFYRDNRDLPFPGFARTELYASFDELRDRFAREVLAADLVVVGSYVPEGVKVGDWVNAIALGRTAFYDIDTPVTLAKLRRGDHEYLAPYQVPRYGMYLSFTGGPTLRKLESELGAACARPLYCSVDPDLYYPDPQPMRWDMGYLGTYSADRQPALERLMLDAARSWEDGQFIVAGAQYPDTADFPKNVVYEPHLPPGAHRAFYNAQRFTLNVTRAAMVRAGWSPSVRLFEAAACATPIVSDRWDGLAEIFRPNREILVADTTSQALRILREMPEDERLAIGRAARARVVAEHTAAHRAEALERYTTELLERQAKSSALLSQFTTIEAAQ